MESIYPTKSPMRLEKRRKKVPRKYVKFSSRSFVAAVKVKKWVVNFTFSTLAIPLVLLAFLLLLHPHREIQAGHTS